MGPHTPHGSVLVSPSTDCVLGGSSSQAGLGGETQAGDPRRFASAPPLALVTGFLCKEWAGWTRQLADTGRKGHRLHLTVQHTLRSRTSSEMRVGCLKSIHSQYFFPRPP